MSDTTRGPKSLAQRMAPSLRRRLRLALRIPPPMVASPLEAFARRSEHAAFACPIARLSHPIGLRFASWNPFVATAAQIALEAIDGYAGSVLEDYYGTVQPRNAAEALLGFDDPPEALAYHHGAAALSTPWERVPPDDMVRKVAEWVRADYLEHGVADVDLTAGFKYFGPTNRQVGDVEFGRLAALVDSLRRRGYDRRHGDILVEVVKRGDEYLYLNSGGGLHRSTTAAALGFETIPARPVRNLIDVDRAGDWPNVRNGLWSTEQARRYVDHLFDYDYLDWARSLGLAGSDDAEPDAPEEVARQRHVMAAANHA